MIISSVKSRIYQFAIVLSMVALTLGLHAIQTVHADTWTVTNNNDSGPGSLRQAIADSSSGDVITFDPSLAGGTIVLATELELSQNLTIDGSNLTPHIAVSGNNSVRVFYVHPDVTVLLNDLDISKGASNPSIAAFPNSGAGIYNDGTLTINHSTISGNSSSYFGGGILNSSTGTLTVLNSTLSNNSAAVYGGGIFNVNTLAVTNSTFSGNSATQALSLGGGVFLAGSGTFLNDTFSGNSAGDGAGIATDAGSSFRYTNTIIANSIYSQNGHDCAAFGGTLTSNLDNLVEDGSCSASLSGDPDLGPLTDNGGPTQTMALLAGSSAIDAGDDASCPATDQRGISRPQGTQCDIGSFELAMAGETSTNTPSETSTPGDTPTDTPTFTPTLSDTPTDTATASDTPTFTPTDTATASDTPTFTSTSTDTPTFTATSTPTPTFTATPTFTSTPGIPGVSSLISPADHAVLNTKRPTFLWAGLPGATGYNLQASAVSSFKSLAINVTLSSTTYTYGSDLVGAATYYWRVRAKNTYGWGPYSAAWDFKTGNPPSVPLLLLPSNNSLVSSYDHVNFSWKPSTTPSGTSFSHYEIQLASDAVFSSPLFDAVPGGPSYAASVALSPNTTYFWHVRAYNTAGDLSGWSLTWSFRTVMSPPTLITPIHDVTVSTLRPLFDWGDVGGASKYTIQISASSSFTPTLVTGSPTASNFTPSKDLPANTPLFWRVQALGTNGPSAWSKESFVTGNPPSVPLLSSPLNLNISSYAPTLSWFVSKNSPSYYQVQIATDPLFSNLILDANTSAARYMLPASTLGNLVQYYWHVRSANSAGQFSDWSAAAWFRSPGQIMGKITNKVGNAGLGGVIVSIQGKTLSGTTDQNGNFTIRGIVPGKYNLVPSVAGYVFSPSSLSVSITAANVSGKSFIASKLETVSGKVVLDPRAHLMSAGPVSSSTAIHDQAGGMKAFTSPGVSGVTVKDNQGHSVQTDQNGNYAITNALPGAYSLDLTKSGYTSIPVSRNFVLSDDALAQYFMIEPIGKPSTIKVYSTINPPDDIMPRFSANGRFVVIPANLDMEGTIIDLYTGQSIPGVGLQADISGDGRYVVFYTWDSLTPDDTNGNPDVYIMDRDPDGNGIFDEPGETSIRRISTMADTSLYNDAYRSAGWPRVSADGRYVVFTSSPFASSFGETIYPGSCGSLFIYEIATQTTTCLPLGSGSGAEISATGRFITFLSYDGTDHFDPNDTNNESDVYVYDRDVDNSGVFDQPGNTLIQRVSIGTDGSQSNENASSGGISADGRYVTFVSYDIGNIDNGYYRNVYLRDRQTGITTPITRKVMINGCMEYLDPYSPHITPDGRFIIFVANSYIPAHTCGHSDSTDVSDGWRTILYDRDIDQNGVFDEPGKTLLQAVNLLVNFAGVPDVVDNNISADGRYIVFSASVTNSENPDRGVYLLDRGTDLSFSITGRITDGNNNPVPGISIDAGNGRMAFTDQDGYYSLQGLPGGTYYLTPSGGGFTFSPTVRAVVVPPSSTGQDFKTTTGYAAVSSLSGRVTDLYDNGLAGVVVDDGNGQQTTTDNQGFYSFTNLPDGSYTLTPSEPGYEFYPQPAPINVHGEDIGGINYSGLKVFSISGRVVDQNGTGISDVVVADDFGLQATTDASGDYTISDVPVGGFTLTPSKTGYTFDPVWQYVEVSSSDITAADFIGQGP